jgi:hypothetical protein
MEKCVQYKLQAANETSFMFVLLSDSELFYAESQTIKGHRGVSGGECKRAVLVVR